jgi:hypothetical protein
MKKPQKLIALRKLPAFFAISLTLAIVSAHGESRAPQPTEGEVTLELFGLIAEQSDCSDYAVAWLESAVQQLHYRCIETLPEAQRFTATVGTEIKFLIDISRAKAEYRRHFGNAGLRRPTSLVAYLLVTFRAKPKQRNAFAPLLVYRPIVQSERSGDNNGFAVRSKDQ